MLPDEPKGWSHLQAMAQRERNPKRLIEIIDQMNRILDEQERKAKRRDAREDTGSSPVESLGP
jgi:hypothetical protein